MLLLLLSPGSSSRLGTFSLFQTDKSFLPTLFATDECGGGSDSDATNKKGQPNFSPNGPRFALMIVFS
jgi:hypothetical protein